jgi:xanthosine utilization system XapX-like protein
MTRYFRGLLVGLVWGLVYGLILREYNAPTVAYAVPISMLAGMAVIDFFRWIDHGDLDK